MLKVFASLEHACLQSFTKVLDSPYLPQVSEEGHSRSSPVLFEAPQLLMAYTCPACDRLSAWHRIHDNQAD